ncbi:MAG: amidase family protein, partial [Alphaproteobacteria bacterium]
KSFSDSWVAGGLSPRHVGDAAVFAAIIEGTDVPGPLKTLDRPRLAFARTPAWAELSQAAHTAGRLAADKARAAGASVIDIELPPAFREALEAQSAIQSYEACRSLAYELRFKNDDLSRALKDYVAAGVDMTRERYDWARNVQASCRAVLWPMFAEIGALITPSAPGEAPANLSVTGSPIANRIWTMAGAPVVGVPGLSGPDGLPIGIQVIGPNGRAAGTLAHAAWLHEVLTKE